MLRGDRLGAAQAARLADELRVRPGQRSWATRAKLVQRDELIREYARRFYPGLSKNQQAQCIARDLGRYSAGSWRRARAVPECPHRDERRKLLWRVLKARDRVLGERYLNDILSGSPVL